MEASLWLLWVRHDPSAAEAICRAVRAHAAWAPWPQRTGRYNSTGGAITRAQLSCLVFSSSGPADSKLSPVTVPLFYRFKKKAKGYLPQVALVLPGPQW